MVGTRDDLEAVFDALVELEVIGWTFFLNADGFLGYQGTLEEDQMGKIIPINPHYVQTLFERVKDNRDWIIPWFQTRTDKDILDCLKRISARVLVMAQVWEERTDQVAASAERWRIQSNHIWEHWTKVWRSTTIIEEKVSKDNSIFTESGE